MFYQQLSKRNCLTSLRMSEMSQHKTCLSGSTVVNLSLVERRLNRVGECQIKH